MDMFGDSSEGEGDDDKSSVEITDLLNYLFTTLVKSRNSCKCPGDSSNADFKIAVVVEGSGTGPMQTHLDQLMVKLRAAKFNQTAFSTTRDMCGLWDCLVYMSSKDIALDPSMAGYVVPGGLLACILPATMAKSNVFFSEWSAQRNDAAATLDNVEYKASIHKRPVLRCNTSGALYWATLSDQLEREAALAEQITVCLSTHERTLGQLSELSVQAAASALSSHGLCVIRGLFSKAAVSATAELTLLDLELAKATLLRRGIDLTKPGTGGALMPYYI